MVVEWHSDPWRIVFSERVFADTAIQSAASNFLLLEGIYLVLAWACMLVTSQSECSNTVISDRCNAPHMIGCANYYGNSTTMSYAGYLNNCFMTI